MVNIFYGMSGSLKYTTMMSGKYKEDFHVFSDIKPFWNYRKILFPEDLPGTDGDFIIQRLLTLRLPGYLPSKDSGIDISIERGVSDSVLCMIENTALSCVWSEDDIKKVIDEETSILEGHGDLKKILLVMKDKDFIMNHVLNEENRLRYYPDIDTYFSKQNSYVQFTKKYNKIDEVIEIEDAFKYINNL